MSGREMALKTLVRVCAQGSYSNLALKSVLEGSTDRRENALASMMVYGVLQRLLTLDYIIQQFSSVKMKKISPNILNILRMGVFQLLFTNKIPPSAAVNESVKLARKYGHGSSAGFVNAVLRAVQRKAVEYPDPLKSPAEYLSVFYSYPEWYCEMLVARLGFEKAEDVLKAGDAPPPFTFRVNTLKADRDFVLESLARRGIRAEKGTLLNEEIILTEGADISKLPEYVQGLIQPQDAASMLVSAVLNPKSGQRVVDVCSAPGGKTTHMAQLMDNKGEIIAFDIHPQRVKLVAEGAKRLGCGIIAAKVHDATVCDEGLKCSADRVLVDAPCSGLGIVRRKPEIKYSATPEGIAGLSSLQYAILRASAQYLRPGGELVYSTCTVTHAENLGVVGRFLDDNPQFEPCPFAGLLPDAIRKNVAPDAWNIQIYPGEYGCDGFFISKIRRKKDNGRDRD